MLMSKSRIHMSTSPGGKYGTGMGTQNGGGFFAERVINKSSKMV